MKKKKDKNFIKKAYYDGGVKAMKAFIKQNLKYPEEALKAGIEGSIPLKLTIDHKGNVVFVKSMHSLGYGCDEEAVRIAQLLKFITDSPRKLKIKYNKDLTIHFKLPQKKAAPVQAQPKQGNQYQYQVVATPKKKGEKESDGHKKRVNYSYTLKL